jgi:hypothetical protein
MEIHVNELSLPGEDNWTKAFNSCSEYYQKAIDPTLSKEVQTKHKEIWFAQRRCLELGIY